MKVRELIERLQQMERDAAVTVGVNVLAVKNGRAFHTRDDVGIEDVHQIGAGVTSVARIETVDDLKLDGGDR